MNRLRLVNGTVEMIRIPETATELKRKVVRPPRTGFGMATKAAANFEKMPIMIRKKQAAYPAFRFAQRVRAMTPLFWVNGLIYFCTLAGLSVCNLPGRK